MLQKLQHHQTPFFIKGILEDIHGISMYLMVFDCIWLNLIVFECIGTPLNKSMVYYNVSEYICNVGTNRIERLHYDF
jgi:hypothetical protein